MQMATLQGIQPETNDHIYSQARPAQEQHDSEPKVACVVKQEAEDMPAMASANTMFIIQKQCSSQKNPVTMDKLQWTNGGSSMTATPTAHEHHHHQASQQQAQRTSAPTSAQQPKSSGKNHADGMVHPTLATALLERAPAVQQLEKPHQQQKEVVLAAARELLHKRQQQRDMRQPAQVEQLGQPQLVLPQLRALREPKRSREPQIDCIEPQAKRFQPVDTELLPEQPHIHQEHQCLQQQQQQQQKCSSGCSPTAALSTSHGAVCPVPEVGDRNTACDAAAVHGDAGPLTEAAFRSIVQANQLLCMAVEKQASSARDVASL